MSYALVIPKHLVKEMYLIRVKTGVSIRKQIIQAIEAHVDDKEKQEISFDKSSIVLKPVSERVSRFFNEKTKSFYNMELGIDMVY